MGQTEKPASENVTPLLPPIQALQALLEKFNHQGVIIGGVAASLLGVPRFTADVDAVFLLEFDDLPMLLKAAAELGIEPRIADPIGFARQSRVLLLRHLSSMVDIDLSMGILPFEVEMVARSHLVDVGSIAIRVPTPEDLIIMKAIAHRPKDMLDIQAIRGNNPELDIVRIQFWVEQFGEALDLPDLWGNVLKLF